MDNVGELEALSHTASYFDGLMQDCSNSIASALVLLRSYTKPSIYNEFGYTPDMKYVLTKNELP